MINVPLDRIGAFTTELHAVHTREHFMVLVSRYGLARTHPEIWANFQWFVDYLRLNSPVEAGIYDMNRYKKVADLMADETGLLNSKVSRRSTISSQRMMTRARIGDEP